MPQKLNADGIRACEIMATSVFSGKRTLVSGGNSLAFAVAPKPVLNAHALEPVVLPLSTLSSSSSS